VVSPPQNPGFSSSAVLAQLPDGEFKRQFIIDCTNCHQFDAGYAYPQGKPRTREDWVSIVARMVGFAGAATGFPIMSPGRKAESTADWLARHLTGLPREDAPLAPDARRGEAEVREYRLPAERDLPHDVAVDSGGTVIVTGMMTHAMYALDTARGTFTAIPIPVPNANPRAVEVAANGDWWVLLGNPTQMARYAPGTHRWNLYPLWLYGHSIALGKDGKAWFNGHFTRDPEQIGYIETQTGTRRVFDAPPHPALARVPGGPIPYELRLDAMGRVWMSELQGHRVLSYTPGSNAWSSHELPRSVSGPRRFDFDESGALWIPAYAGNSLVHLVPATRATREYPLPRADAAPYVARVHGNTVWIGTNASDEVYAFDIPSGTFTVYPLPSRGAVIRHLVIDPRNRDVWLAYGGSPGIAARIARLRVARTP